VLMRSFNIVNMIMGNNQLYVIAGEQKTSAPVYKEN
jgi:hypothetical protein